LIGLVETQHFNDNYKCLVVKSFNYSARISICFPNLTYETTSSTRGDFSGDAFTTHYKCTFLIHHVTFHSFNFEVSNDYCNAEITTYDFGKDSEEHLYKDSNDLSKIRDNIKMNSTTGIIPPHSAIGVIKKFSSNMYYGFDNMRYYIMAGWLNNFGNIKIELWGVRNADDINSIISSIKLIQ
jgi:hypothetical protein